MTDDAMQRAMEKSRLDGTYEEGPFTAGWWAALAHVDEMAAKLVFDNAIWLGARDSIVINTGRHGSYGAPTLTEALEAATREVIDA